MHLWTSICASRSWYYNVLYCKNCPSYQSEVTHNNIWRTELTTKSHKISFIFHKFKSFRCAVMNTLWYCHWLQWRIQDFQKCKRDANLLCGHVSQISCIKWRIYGWRVRPLRHLNPPMDCFFRSPVADIKLNARDAFPLPAKISSFSCSFREKLVTQYVGGPLWGWRSGKSWIRHCQLITTFSF